MELLAVVLLLAVASTSLLWPLRRHGHGRPMADADAEAAWAARETKLQEIRDLELDLRLNKLTPSDFRRLDDALRAEAVQLTRRLDATRERAGRASTESA